MNMSVTIEELFDAVWYSPSCARSANIVEVMARQEALVFVQHSTSVTSVRRLNTVPLQQFCFRERNLRHISRPLEWSKAVITIFIISLLCIRDQAHQLFNSQQAPIASDASTI